MEWSRCVFAFFVAVAVTSCSLRGSTVEAHGVNGGTDCALCTSMMATIEQLAEVRNKTISQTLGEICDVFSQPEEEFCKLAIDYITPFLLKALEKNNGPDAVCHALNFCYTDPGKRTCRLMNSNTPSKLPFHSQVASAKASLKYLKHKLPLAFKLCDIPGIKQICEIIDRPTNDPEPAIDLDRDGFSTAETFRGSFWRGKDCSDVSASIHPGAMPHNHDVAEDTNCNGIYGLNKNSGTPYEDELCKGTEQRGIAVLGDSLGAHFSLPPAWFDATKFSKEAFKPFLTVLEDTFDWPMLSSITGHVNNTWQEVIEGPMESVYNYMFQRNRCMHRDFQNLGVNGAWSGSVHKYMSFLSRVQGRDYPLVVALELVGNDVCRGKGDNLAGTTSPEDLYNNTLTTLKFLDSRLPKNSSVLVFSMIDGRVLFDYMHNRTHPIGNYWKNLNYAQFYDFLNCLEVSPCPGWLTSNQTIRDMAFKNLQALNGTLKRVVDENEGSFKNFKLKFVDVSFEKMFADWLAQGGEGWQLIQPFDGFHTSQLGQSKTAEWIWKAVNDRYPDVFGPVNPNNDRIKEIFGDQGGF